MKSDIKNKVLTIALLPIAALFLIMFLVYTPIDYCLYRFMRYYRDTHEKYSWMCTASFYIKLYNCIQREQLPIQYYRDATVAFTGYGYFVYEDVLIIADADASFNDEQGYWEVEAEETWISLDKYVAKELENCNTYLQKEICVKAIVLVDSDLIEEHTSLQGGLYELLPVKNERYGKALSAKIAYDNKQ